MIRISSPTRNQKVKYLLGKWLYYDENMDCLSDVELVKMKVLYASLKELTEEEQEFLAAKYRVKRRPYIRDDVLAKQYDMSLKDYRAERIRIESKLNPIILKNSKKYKEEHATYFIS